MPSSAIPVTETPTSFAFTADHLALFEKLSREFTIPANIVKNYALGQRRFLVKLATQKRKTMAAYMQFAIGKRAAMIEIKGNDGIVAEAEATRIIKDRTAYAKFAREILEAMDPTKDK